MRPLIKHGNYLTIKLDSKKKLQSYNVGDIPAYIQKGSINAHRIIKKVKNKNNKYKYLVKGDNNVNSDGFFYKAFFIGRVISIKNNKKMIDLTNPSSIFIQKVLFTNYSKANSVLPQLLNLNNLEKIPFIKKIYQKLIYSPCFFIK